MVMHLDPIARASLEEQLMRLDGIIHATVDPRSGELWVVRDPGFDHGPIELAIRNRLASLGHDPAGVNVHITLPTDPGPRRRVRFVDASRTDENGYVTVTVRLEWNDRDHVGSARGEKGLAVELRTAAQAALNAIQDLSGQELSVRLIGVKIIHAFDSDLMVASLLRVDGVHQRLVGTVVVSDDLIGAAAVAVLSALNRTLGNFLHTPD